MASIIAAAAGACVPGCAGLLAATSSFVSFPLLGVMSVASAVGMAYLTKSKEEETFDLTGSTEERQPPPIGTKDFL